MIGVEERDTKTGIHVVRLHYTADPRKRTEEWKARAFEGFGSRQIAREYEIDWTVASGKPVYSDFNREWHVAKEPLKAIKGRPIIRGWDLGPTHVLPACVCSQLDALGRLNVLYEVGTWDGRGEAQACSIPEFADRVILECNVVFPDLEFVDYCDPAGWGKSMTDEKSAIDILISKGIHCRRGAVSMVARRRAMEERLKLALGARAALLVSPLCQMVIEGLAGAYKYEEARLTEGYKSQVDKNAWSHYVNGLEYLVSGIYGVKRRGDDDDRREKRPIKRDKMTGY